MNESLPDFIRRCFGQRVTQLQTSVDPAQNVDHTRVYALLDREKVQPEPFLGGRWHDLGHGIDETVTIRQHIDPCLRSVGTVSVDPGAQHVAEKNGLVARICGAKSFSTQSRATDSLDALTAPVAHISSVSEAPAIVYSCPVCERNPGMLAQDPSQNALMCKAYIVVLGSLRKSKHK